MRGQTIGDTQSIVRRVDQAVGNAQYRLVGNICQVTGDTCRVLYIKIVTPQTRRVGTRGDCADREGRLPALTQRVISNDSYTRDRVHPYRQRRIHTVAALCITITGINVRSERIGDTQSIVRRVDQAVSNAQYRLE